MGKKAMWAVSPLLGAASSMMGSGGKARPQIDAGRTDYRQAVLDRTKDSRENTLKLMAELEAQAKGEGPSAGTQALTDTSRRNLAQTLAAASMQRGPGMAAQKRGLVRQQGAAERNIAEQGSIIRAQEQLGAQDALSRLAEQQQAADLQQVMQPGGVVASAESARFEQAIKAAEEARKSKGKEAGAALGLLGTIVGGVAGGIGGAAAGGVGAVPGAVGGAAAGGAIGTGVGTVAGEQMSDERQKKDVSSAKPKVKSFLDALEAKKYTYKDDTLPGTAPGKRFGILAQDLEKSEMGKSLVKETPMGKMVDTVQGFGAVLAAQAELHKRLKKLEKGKSAVSKKKSDKSGKESNEVPYTPEMLDYQITAQGKPLDRLAFIQSRYDALNGNVNRSTKDMGGVGDEMGYMGILDKNAFGTRMDAGKDNNAINTFLAAEKLKQMLKQGKK